MGTHWKWLAYGQSDANDPKRSFLLACAEDLSPTRLLNTNRVTFRHDLAIPIRTETCRVMKVRKPHGNKNQKASHDEGK